MRALADLLKQMEQIGVSLFFFDIVVFWDGPLFFIRFVMILRDLLKQPLSFENLR